LVTAEPFGELHLTQACALPSLDDEFYEPELAG